jgi:hypothetical protein
MTTEVPRTDSTAEFAADLRALRLDAGSPTLARLQHEAGISTTVLSDAFAGRTLPSARTVDRIVRALGGDSVEWVRRRDALGSTIAETGSVASRDPRPRTVRRRTAALMMAGTFLVGALVAGLVSWGVSTTAVAQAATAASAAARHQILDAPLSPHAQINVRNGVDPAMTPCVNDAKVATSSSRADNTLLEIIWSNKCYAGWARITRYDEKFSGNSMTVAIYPETAPQGPDRQTATEPNVQSAYTTLVVRPSPRTRLCAVGTITIDGESIDLGEPLCT